jgi:hypothetical protein
MKALTVLPCTADSDPVFAGQGDDLKTALELAPLDASVER